MKRNLKALGLAVVAMFAIGAITAVGAQANEEGHFVSAFEESEHETSNIFGTDGSEQNPLALTSAGGAIDCSVNEFHGEISGGTTKELTLETTFGGAQVGSGCTAGGFPATVFNNDCHISLYTLETAIGSDWRVGTDLSCPEGQPGIVIKAYSGGAHGFQVCQVVIPPQTGLSGSTVHAEVRILWIIQLWTAHVTTHLTQSGLCGSGEEEAEIHGEVALMAESQAQETQVDFLVEHTE